jgi:hypothetical protein
MLVLEIRLYWFFFLKFLISLLFSNVKTLIWSYLPSNKSIHKYRLIHGVEVSESFSQLRSSLSFKTPKFYFPRHNSPKNLPIYIRINSEAIQASVLMTTVSTLLHIAAIANQVQFCRVQTRILVLIESAYEDVSCILYYSQTDDCWNFL